MGEHKVPKLVETLNLSLFERLTIAGLSRSGALLIKDRDAERAWVRAWDALHLSPHLLEKEGEATPTGQVDYSKNPDLKVRKPYEVTEDVALTLDKLPTARTPDEACLLAEFRSQVEDALARFRAGRAGI
jgi:hypothetical protein